MPIEFSSRRDVTMIQLLEQSGYIESRKEIDKEKILEYVKMDKNIIFMSLMLQQYQNGFNFG